MTKAYLTNLFFVYAATTKCQEITFCWLGLFLLLLSLHSTDDQTRIIFARIVYTKNKKATSNKFLVGGNIFVFSLFLFFLSTAAAKLFFKMISKIGDETNKKFLILSVGNFFVLFFFFLPRCKFFQWKGWLTFLLSFFLSHKKTILAQPQKIGRDKRNDF